MDFTLKTYRQLLHSLQVAGFSFITFSDYIESYRDSGSPASDTMQDEKLDKIDGPTPSSFQLPASSFVILRHDVDLLPQNSLAFARIQHEMGIRGSYYFRAVPESWDEAIIKEIADLGHEIGYHYENLTTCNGDMEAGIKDFELHLSNLRKIAPVNTICMHGSPKSKWDSKDLWKKYNYRDFGIIGEPYFDMDFDDVFYLTDTGRRWDGWKVSVRDKVPQQERWIKEGLVFRSTHDIIRAIETTKLAVDLRSSARLTTPSRLPSNVYSFASFAPPLHPLRFQAQPQSRIPPVAGLRSAQPQPQPQPFPPRVMFTFHPQRWTDRPGAWLKELVVQNLKNQVKRLIVSTGR